MKITIDTEEIIDQVVAKLVEPPCIVREGREDALKAELLESVNEGGQELVEDHIKNDIIRQIIGAIQPDENPMEQMMRALQGMEMDDL